MTHSADIDAARVWTEVHSQFWRESEQRWVDHVSIRTWGSEKDEPRKWRHRVTTFTERVGDWEDGKRPTRVTPPGQDRP
jgi:hypothetical protein